MRRGLALSADGLRLIIWRDSIFFLCVSKSLVFLALFFGPMPHYVAEVPWYLTEPVSFFLDLSGPRTHVLALDHTVFFVHAAKKS